MRFEWDPAKNKLNRKRHGISFEEAVFVFTDQNALSIFDEKHSESEDRWITIGSIPAGKTLVVIHTDRIGDVIRVISARKATRDEKQQYVEAYVK